MVSSGGSPFNSVGSQGAGVIDSPGGLCGVVHTGQDPEPSRFEEVCSAGAGPTEICDLFGNVWEWALDGPGETRCRPHPGEYATGASVAATGGEGQALVSGGSWRILPWEVDLVPQAWMPDYASAETGFRVVWDRDPCVDRTATRFFPPAASHRRW